MYNSGLTQLPPDLQRRAAIERMCAPWHRCRLHEQLMDYVLLSLSIFQQVYLRALHSASVK